MSDLECWIWFSGLQCLRLRTRRALMERFGGVKGIYDADRRELEALPGLLPEERAALLDRTGAEPARIVRRCAELRTRIITFQDADYPERLRNIPDPPYVLYVRGDLPAVDTEAVIGVVGTRRSSPYGERMTRRIAAEIAAGGGIVATGLAAGIDSRAAESALDAGGTVIGVLGVAINHVYPSANAPLYAEVEAHGAPVSEYPPDAKGSRDWFPQRNRIIAALSLGVVVTEAPVRSGALITAHRAADYGRDVFAVPANADSAKGRGSNRLLREGASLAENGWDILSGYAAQFPEKLTRPAAVTSPDEPGTPAARETGDFYRFRSPNPDRGGAEAPKQTLEAQLEQLTETQLKIVGAMDRASMHVDDIIDLTRLPASAVLSEMTMLQLKGYVRQEPGKRFTLNISK